MEPLVELTTTTRLSGARASCSTGGGGAGWDESDIEGAVGVEAGDAVAGDAVDRVEGTSDQNFSVGLDDDGFDDAVVVRADGTG